MMISHLSKIISSLLVVTAKATELSTLHDWHQIQPDTASLLLPSSISTNLRRRCTHSKCDTMIAGNPSTQVLSIGNLGVSNMQHRRIERRRKLSWAGSLYNMLRIPGLKRSHPDDNSAGGSSGNSAGGGGGGEISSDSSSRGGHSGDKSLAGSGGGGSRSSGEGSPGNGGSGSGSASNSGSSGGTSSTSSGGGISGGAGGGSEGGGSSNGGSSGGTSSSSSSGGSSSGSSSSGSSSSGSSSSGSSSSGSSSSGGSSSGGSSSGGSSSGGSSSGGSSSGGSSSGGSSSGGGGGILIMTSAALSLSIGAMYIGGRRARRAETGALHPLHGAVKKRAAVFSLIATRSNTSRPEAPTLSIDKTDIAANTNYVLA